MGEEELSGPGLRDQGDPRRSGPRSDDRRRRHADLAGDDVRPAVRRCTPRLRVLALGQPDAHGSRALRGLAGGGRPRVSRSPADWPPRTRCCGAWSGGGRVLLGNDAYGGTYRLIANVWGPLGVAWDAVDLTDVDALAASWPDDTTLVWLESPTNPAAQLHRHRSGRRPRPRTRGAGRRRQHVRHAVPPTTARPRRRRRRPLGDEVPRRAQRRRRRIRRRRRRRARRPAALPPERSRGGTRTVRLLPRPARRQDARRAHGSPLQQCPGRRRPPRAPPSGRARVLPATPRPSRATPRRRSRCPTSAGWSASP